MRFFCDSEGRQWPIKVTVDVIEKVREIGVDLGDVTGTTIRTLTNDDVLLVRSLWIICEASAKTVGVTATQFGEALVGDSIDDAFDALRGSIEDFFPRRKREYWLKMIEADRDTQTEALRIGLESLNDQEIRSRISEAVRDRVKVEIEKSLTRLRSVTDSPA
jgi:hypothetical protein